jgi:ankyrin repeat protein
VETRQRRLKALAPTKDCEELFVCDKYEMTPFHLACENGHKEAVRYFLGLCGQLTDGSEKKATSEKVRRGSALFLAERNQHATIMDMLKDPTSGKH